MEKPQIRLMTMEAKVLLHDEMCEQQVLGVLLGCRDCYDLFQDYCTEEVFFSQANRYIFQCISGVISEGKSPDVVSVFEFTQKHPKPGCSEEDCELLAGTIAELSSSVTTTTTFVQNCMRLADLLTRRKMYVIGSRLMAAGTSEIGDTDDLKAKTLEELQALDDRPQTTVRSVKDALVSLNKIVSDNISGTRTIGYPTGFNFLDEKGGMQPTDLWVIAAEFSQGKTSLALDFCLNAATAGYAAAFYSTEMMSTQLAARMVAGKSGISSRVIMQCPLEGDTLFKFDLAIGKLEGLPIYFDDTSTLSVERIISSIRSMVRNRGVKIAFVDYLQTLQTNERNMRMTEEQFFGLTARKFKNLAKELQICIVLISQIARSKDTTEPTLSRIRGSGQINEAADVVLLIYRAEFYNKSYSGNRCNVSTHNTAQIKLAKGRNIGTGDFICGYNAPVTHFYELESIPMIENNQEDDVDNDRPF